MLFLSVSDELSSILKKLSLEKYQPIFEEQEVLCLFWQRGISKYSLTIKLFSSLLECTLIHSLSAWRKPHSNNFIIEPAVPAWTHFSTYIKYQKMRLFNLWLVSYSELHPCLSDCSRWTWRHSWLSQMETWRSWALKQMDPDNRSWLPYQSSMLERCVWLKCIMLPIVCLQGYMLL